MLEIGVIFITMVELLKNYIYETNRKFGFSTLGGTGRRNIKFFSYTIDFLINFDHEFPL